MLGGLGSVTTTEAMIYYYYYYYYYLLFTIYYSRLPSSEVLNNIIQEVSPLTDRSLKLYVKLPYLHHYGA